jgi:glutamine---fructose-6-phosphate transaminase (isomerizing)
VTGQPSRMALEIGEIPEAAARLLDREGGTLRDVGSRLAALSPPVLMTCARGSSDHAAGFGKYLAEIMLGTPAASLGPSIASIYGAKLRVAGAALLSVSQSGMSPDIVALQAAARDGGAYAIAIVNTADSPLAAGADSVVPLHCGVEVSVAATKTCVISAVAAATIVAHWSGDRALLEGVKRLPEALAAALAMSWTGPAAAFAGARSCYVIGRGPAFPLAQELALKFKETAVLHAEAYSSAEVMHGPLQLVSPGFPVVALHPQDAAEDAVERTIARIAAAGGKVFAVGPGRCDGADVACMPAPPSVHPLLDALPMLAGLYALVEAVARMRGRDPDRPTLLSKVTVTI